MTKPYSDFKPRNWKQKVLYCLATLFKETKVFEPKVVETRYEHIAFERIRIQQIVEPRFYEDKGFGEYLLKKMAHQIGEELLKHQDMYDLKCQDEVLYRHVGDFLPQKVVTLQISVVKPEQEQRRMVFREEAPKSYFR